MSIRTVKLPNQGDSDSDSSSDFAPPPPKPLKTQPPKREDVITQEPAEDPFEVKENEDAPVPQQNLNYPSLGLPPLSFDSDPFLSPLNHVQFVLKRHRIWIKGIKGVKFSCSINGYTVLVAKRKMKYLKKTWFISRSFDFSLDTPDLAGILVKQRKGISYTLFSPKERQKDQYREVLAGIQLKDRRQVIIGTNLWAPPSVDDIFELGLISPQNSYPLHSVNEQYEINSVKNGSFARDGTNESCLTSSKQANNAALVDVKGPLSLVHAFGIAIALFVQ